RCCSLAPPHSLANHPPLPSFPTRRSSDLAGVGRPQHAQHDQGEGHVDTAVEEVEQDRRNAVAGDAPHAGLSLRAEDAAPEPCPEDRKSTRLNSSHVKISYAVFCLKKKNTA